MASVLTEHVRSFDGDSDPTEKVLPTMERLLRYHMRQKSLLVSPPGYLGYPGVSNWSGPGAFEDIVADCYVFAVLDRLTALRNQLKIKPNVDGLISRNVANFLLERQRRNDLIGYAVFGNVKGAAAEAAEAKLIVLENLERGKIHNGSILRFSREGPTASTDLVGNALATAGGFDGAVRDLTETTEEGRLWVLGFLRQLQETGAGSVRFGDLVAVLARRVRAEWGARHADAAADVAWEGTEDFGSLVHLVHPDEGVESRERWERLKRLIPERISQLNRQKRVRERLLRVFAALVEAVEEGGHAPPTQAELTERTGVARATVSDDFGLLREIITGLDAPNPDE